MVHISIIKGLANILTTIKTECAILFDAEQKKIFNRRLTFRFQSAVNLDDKFAPRWVQFAQLNQPNVQNKRFMWHCYCLEPL